MFFQTTDAQSEASKQQAPVAPVGFDAVSKYLKESVNSADSLSKILEGTFDIFEKLIIQSEELNKTFVGGRLRIQEMQKAINAAVPDVVRLGGSYEDVGKTLADIAAGTRTQILATSKDVKELFAAGKVLDTSVLNLVDAFDKVGYSYNTIADNLEKSIVYVQSIGQNARAVMKDVVSNTEQLSRFNFANGVQGLTKMAAQASLMRFDMGKTFDFADKMLDPEAAIEMSSAFQRLGVSVGNLTDPLSLVNQSLTDPSGLQTSLINMTKQFTYFDEQTKSFKINPQGILTMRELATATGISAAELRKTALAAAEMDSKLAKINETGLNFQVSDENKMMIANIARMGEGGEYEVSIKDDRGYEMQKKLTELTSEDFSRLIEQQSKAPKTIEEIQQSQLNTAELMLSELKGMRETLTSAFLGLPGMMSSVEGAAKLTRDATQAAQIALRDTSFQKSMQTISDRAEKIRNEGLAPEEEKKQLNELYQEAKTKIGEQAPQIMRAAGVELSTIAKEQNEQVRKFTETVTGYFSGLFGKEEGKQKGESGLLPKTPGQNASDYGILSKSYTSPITSNAAAAAATGLARGSSQLEVEFTNPSLTINVNVTGPAGMDSTTLTQVIREAQGPLQEEIYKAVKTVAVSRGEVKPVIG